VVSKIRVAPSPSSFTLIKDEELREQVILEPMMFYRIIWLLIKRMHLAEFSVLVNQMRLLTRK